MFVEIAIVILIIIISYLVIFIENFEDEELNMYNYCNKSYIMKNCVPTKKCLEFGYDKICS